LATESSWAAWQRSGAKIDADVAMDIYTDIMQREPLPVCISEALEHKLLNIIHQATGVTIQPVEPE